jgi:hypothetical protein
VTAKVDDFIAAGGRREDIEGLPVVDFRPEIDTGNLGLDEMAAAAWDVIDAGNSPGRVFLYAGTLAWIIDDAAAGRPVVQIMNQDHVRHLLAEVARFIRWTVGGKGQAPKKKPAFPPVPLAADLLAVPRLISRDLSAWFIRPSSRGMAAG